MDKFDKQVKEEVQGYLNNHVHFSLEESRKIRRKLASKSTTKKFHGVYYTVLATAVILFIILSFPLFNTINFNSNSQFDYPGAAENDTKDINNNNIKASLDNVVHGKDINRSRKMFSDESTNNIQLSINNNLEKYKLKKASLNYWSKSGEYKNSDSSKEVTLGLSFQSQKNSYFTQIFKDEINLEDHHKVIEKVGNWSLIPDTEIPGDIQENKYIIAVTEKLINHEKYTIIVQTYDLHDDIYANPYSKTEILDFIESLQPESAIKYLLEIVPEELEHQDEVVVSTVDKNKEAVRAVLESKFTVPNEEYMLIVKKLDKK